MHLNKISPLLHVRKIGVELEGGFRQKASGENYHGDGSVHVPSTESVTVGFVGEVVSRPFDDLEMMLDWVDHYYPDRVNKSCGCHVHVSFNCRLAYMLTMSQEYYDFWLMRQEKWGKRVHLKASSEFWKRLQGNNHYCKKMPKTAKALVCEGQKGTRGDYGCDRYYQLNHCWSKHKTLESRVLPCFSSRKLTISGVKEFVNMTNDFLSQCKREPEYTTELLINEPDENRIMVEAV